jgi:RNA recognition motif-containing protein
MALVLMTRRVFVSNLPFTLEIEAVESALRDVFGAYGTVRAYRQVYEGTELRPKGLCFVEMANRSEALAAIEALDGIQVLGHQLKVGEARPFRLLQSA